MDSVSFLGWLLATFSLLWVLVAGYSTLYFEMLPILSYRVLFSYS